MNKRTKAGLEVLEAAILLGVLGDALLHTSPWGLNVLLWVGALAVAAFALSVRWRGVTLKSEGNWLYVPLIFFAASFAWRDSPALKSLNVIAILTILSLLTLRSMNLKIKLLGISHYIYGAIVSCINAITAPFILLMSDIEWKTIPRKGWTKHLFAVFKGLMIAVPLLFIFGLLFIAADAVFAGLVNRAFNFNGASIFSHLFLMCVFAWLVGGYLRSVSMGFGALELAQRAMGSAAETEEQTPYTSITNESEESKDEAEKEETEKQKEQMSSSQPPKRFLSLGIIEIGTVLGLVNLLFAIFVFVQIRYFFGGAELIQTTTHLTYSDYARRGFFELVTVALLVLPILLAAHWLLKKDNPLNEKIFRILAGVKVVLLFVIMASAMKRMMLYQSEYGQTELRLYTTAFMFWLALVFVWFLLTVLRGLRERFAYGALVSAFLVLGGLHVLNPDDYIVRVNVQRASEGKDFDARYAAWLSADAVPALEEAMPAMTRQNRCIIAGSFLERLKNEKSSDFRSWNWSNSRARKILHQQEETIKSLNCPQQIPESDRSNSID